MLKNKHFNAVLTKFLLVITVLGVVLPAIGDITTFTAVMAAIIGTFAAYFIADLVVLSLYGNRVAVLADVIIILAVAYETVHFMEENPYMPPLGLIIIALLIGLGEWYYHSRYLARLIYKGRIKP